MSKSITELFSFNNVPTQMPTNYQTVGNIRSANSIASGKSTLATLHNANVVQLNDTSTSKDTKKIPDNQNPRRYVSPAKYNAHVTAIENDIKLIGDTLRQYEQAKLNPSTMIGINNSIGTALFGDSWHDTSKDINAALNVTKTISGSIDDIANQLLTGMSRNGVVMMPSDAHIIENAIRDISKNVDEANGKKVDYGVAKETYAKDLMTKIKGRKPVGMSHEFDVVKYEDGTIGRYPGIYTSEINQQRGPGMIISNTAEIERDDSTSKSTGRLHDDYLYFEDPYSELSEPSTSPTSISKVQEELTRDGYLVGYKNFAGFELGTNHKWMIRMRPYESIEHGQLTCTPPLPAYALPNIWSTNNKLKSIYGDPFETISKLDQVTGSDKIWDCESEFIQDLDSSGTLRWFSYAENTPVLSYDLNFGTFKSETIRLFNSSFNMFMGVEYNAILSLSILDDSYCSMYKYMNTYINSIYDPVTNSVAPYYNMAFEVELTIFRTGNQINHKHKFICIPLDYTPRLEGTQDPNELRVELTMAIIGYVPYSKGNASTISTDVTFRDNNSVGESFKTYGTKAKNLRNPLDSMPVSDIKWGDIQLNMGRSKDTGSSAVFGNNVNDKSLGSSKGVTNEEYQEILNNNK